MGKSFFTFFPVMLATAFSVASAYTLSGTVKNEADEPISGATVKLLQKDTSVTTDSEGKFKIEEKTEGLLSQGSTPGYIGINNGILHFAQGSSAPVQVQIFDMVGNQILRQTLQGSGQVDLRQGVSVQGTYIARVRVGSVQQSIKFRVDGAYHASFSTTPRKALLKVEDDSGDTLLVAAADYDTLRVYLSMLDTNLSFTLKKPGPVTPTSS